jgi:hypothetical protein
MMMRTVATEMVIDGALRRDAIADSTSVERLLHGPACTGVRQRGAGQVICRVDIQLRPLGANGMTQLDVGLSP